MEGINYTKYVQNVAEIKQNLKLRENSGTFLLCEVNRGTIKMSAILFQFSKLGSDNYKCTQNT